MARKAKVVPSVVTVAEQSLISQMVDQVTKPVTKPVIKAVVAVAEQSLVSQMVDQVTEHSVTEPVIKVDEKNVGVGLFIRKLINEGLSNKDILPIVHEQYGNTNTTYACVAWYRNKMKKAGQVVTKSNNIDWIQNFAKVNGLSEESVSELMLKVG